MSSIPQEVVRAPVLRAPMPDSLMGAVTELFSAGQQLILDRIALLRVELTADARRVAVGAGTIAGAAVFALVGWVALSAALAALLVRWLPLDGSLAITGAVNLVIAGIAAAIGVRRLGRKEESHG
jgi:hypothetical protein